ncbi:uncharacterized protein BJ212DRAFT_1477881 [Suillus subaureus]|uniref:Uncharacterized protein n=1 Tax=Suillus subaureus TaxID=48587 RepID=A0A9P7EIS3_9AGAM|nr:uncharacterized protein BJ212DRAFT_1477881 [Suillus subaureus]KAG1822052.1 hypothetical protein BJ212DRAFT_1477881 [Suillus subaureus]
MNEDINSEFGDEHGDTLVNADMHSLSSSGGEHMDTGSWSALENEFAESENVQSATYESNADLFNGDEESDDEADEGAGSELEDECSKFRYGDLEERIIEDDNEDDASDGVSEIDLGDKDGEGAAENKEDYDDYGEY